MRRTQRVDRAPASICETHSAAAEVCAYCPSLCQRSCPVSGASGNHSLTPQAKMQTLFALHRGDIPWHSEITPSFFACTGCGACQTECHHDINVADALFAGRQIAREVQSLPDDMMRLPQRLRQREDDLGRKLTRFLAKLPHRSASPPNDDDRGPAFAYLPGCHAIEDRIDDVGDARALFDRLDRGRYDILGADLVCAGYPIWASGDTAAAKRATEKILGVIRPYRRIVSACAPCVDLLRNRLPAEGYSYSAEIIHLSEFLAREAGGLAVHRRYRTAYYHDSCYLGRQLNIYDEPRDVASRVTEVLHEYYDTRQKSGCCGGAGLLPMTAPDISSRQGERRLEEPAAFGADIVISGSTECTSALARHVSTPRDHDDEPTNPNRSFPQVVSLVSALAWATSCD